MGSFIIYLVHTLIIKDRNASIESICEKKWRFWIHSETKYSKCISCELWPTKSSTLSVSLHDILKDSFEIPPDIINKTFLSFWFRFQSSWQNYKKILFPQCKFITNTPSIPLNSIYWVWAWRLRNMCKVVEKRKKSGWSGGTHWFLIYKREMVE